MSGRFDPDLLWMVCCRVEVGVKNGGISSHGC
jgi:hypothetical protein